MRIQFRLIQSFSRQKAVYWLMPMVIVLFSACLTDIRTSYMLDTAYDKDIAIAEGKKWITKMSEAHKTNYFKNLETYSVAFTDEYFGIKGSVANPHNEKKTFMELHLIPGTFDSRADFDDGHVWSLQAWHTFKSKSGESLKEVQSKKIKFWLATYQYFIELPYRIIEGSVIRYAGEEMHQGNLCAKVFVSWQQERPVKAIDQYVLWIEVSTGRLSLVEFTIRDMLFARKGVAYYSGYTWRNDILIPSEIEVRTNLKTQQPLHKMNILNFYPNQKELEYIRNFTSLKARDSDIK